MVWFISQSILVIAAAFLLGILVGWLIWGRTWSSKRAKASEAEADAHGEAPVTAAAAVAAPQAPEPEPAEEPEPEPVVVAEREPEPVTAEAVAVAEPEVAQEPEPVAVAAVAGDAPAAEAETVAAQPVAAVATGEPETPEDLERIEGIGPKMAAALHKAGIRTYAQLASADEAKLRHAIESGGMRFAPSLVTWGRQAQLLADGDEEGFADLTRRLVAGRDEGRE